MKFFVSLIFFYGLYYNNALCADHLSTTKAILEKFAQNLNHETSSPVFVVLKPDKTCLNETNVDFSTVPQVSLSEKKYLTILRYFGNKICVDILDESRTGIIHFNKNNSLTIKGDFSEKDRYVNISTQSFLVVNSEDWEKLYLSVPRYVSMKMLSVMINGTINIHKASKNFSYEVAKKLGDITPQRLAEKKSKYVVVNRLPGLIYIFFLVLTVVICIIYGKKLIVVKNKKVKVKVVIYKPIKIKLDFGSIQDQDGNELNPIVSLMDNFVKLGVPEKEIEAIKKHAFALFKKINQNEDPAVAVKVRHYLAKELEIWQTRLSRR